MEQTAPALSVVVPAYNEERRLGPSLVRIAAFLESYEPAHEIIVVDDGSTDRTVEVARAALPADAPLRIVELGRNRGKGAAVRAGILAASGDRILFSDADLATPIEELGKLDEALRAGHDIAIASRGLPDADIRVRQHPLREIIGRSFNLLVRAVLWSRIRDTQCGFKLFSRAAARDVFERVTFDGFAFDVEVLFLAERRGYRIAEIPVTWRHVEESKVSRLAGARSFADVLRIRARHL